MWLKITMFIRSERFNLSNPPGQKINNELTDAKVTTFSVVFKCVEKHLNNIIYALEDRRKKKMNNSA